MHLNKLIILLWFCQVLLNFEMPSSFSELEGFRAKHKNKICIGHINVNSIRKEEDRPLITLKREYLDMLKLDLLCVQEAKVDNSTSDIELLTSGYKVFREGRKKSGGTILYVRDEIAVSRIPLEPQNKFTSIECIMLHMNFASESLIFVCLYRRPSISLAIARQEISYVLTIASSIESDVVVIGDINLCSLGTHDRQHTELLHDLCDQFRVTCLVHETTRPVSGSCIDQILATDDMVSDVMVHEPGLSDHYMLVSSLNLDRPPIQKRTLICRSFKNFDPEKFLYDINEAIPVFGVSSIFDSIDDVYSFVRVLYTEILERHAPLKVITIRPNSVPWFNGKMAYARRMKHYWLNRAPIDKYTGKRNHSCYAWERKTHWQKIERSLNREAAAQYFKDKCESENHNDFYRTFGSYMKSRKCKDDSKVILKDDSNYLVHDEEISSRFGQYFQNIGKNEDSERIQGLKFDELDQHQSIELIKNEVTSMEQDQEQFHFSTTNPTEVEAVINKLKTSKAAGIDGLPARVIKSSASLISVVITSIFNLIIQKCEFPKEIKQGIWVPVFKNGSKSDVSRYRPITLLPHFAKIIESLMTQQFSQYVLPLLSPFQFAYKKNHSTETALMYIIENWKMAIDSRQIVAAVSLDLSAAFDSIPHELLLRKMSAYGMSTNGVNLMRSYLVERYNKVKVNGKLSDSFHEVSRGIPQGSQWGPLVWNAYINDLFPLILKNGAKVIGYADDITYWITGRSVTEVQNKIKSILPIILKWFNDNGLKPNPKKFQCIGLGNGGENIQFTAEDVILENLQSIQLLGLRIDQNFTFELQVKKFTRTVAWKLSGIRRLKNSISRTMRWRLIQTYVMPHFDYVSSMYLFLSASGKRKLQTMHNRCLRMATKNFSASISELITSLNTCELEVRWHMRLFKLMQSVAKTVQQCNRAENSKVFLRCFQSSPGYSPIALCELFEVSSETSMARRNVFKQPRVKTVKFGERSLRFYGTSFWNKVPIQIRECNVRSKTVIVFIRKFLQQQSGITSSIV